MLYRNQIKDCYTRRWVLLWGKLSNTSIAQPLQVVFLGASFPLLSTNTSPFLQYVANSYHTRGRAIYWGCLCRIPWAAYSPQPHIPNPCPFLPYVTYCNHTRGTYILSRVFDISLLCHTLLTSVPSSPMLITANIWEGTCWDWGSGEKDLQNQRPKWLPEMVWL